MIAPETESRRTGRSSGSIWAWFFAGVAIGLALMLAALIWAISTAGLTSTVLARLDPRGDRAGLVPAVAALLPTASTAIPTALAPIAAAATPTAGAATPVAAAATPIAGPAATVATAATPTVGAATPVASPTPRSNASPTPPPVGTGAGVATPAGTPRAEGALTARLGEAIDSGTWRVAVARIEIGSTARGRRVGVDILLKNGADAVRTLEIPNTTPRAPRARTVSLTDDATPLAWQDVQLADAPALSLMAIDRRGQAWGGGFRGADGDAAGAYTFLATPGDAIRLPFAFDLPEGAGEPAALELRFGVDAGGVVARVVLDGPAPSALAIQPSDPPRLAVGEQRVVVGNTWAFTLLGIDVGAPSAAGARGVTARVRAENLSDRALLLGASRDDSTGTSRDFYIVDRDLRLAYSTSETMPTARIPAGATRAVEIKLLAPADFATNGPYRFSIVVDPRRGQYAVMRSAG